MSNVNSIRPDGGTSLRPLCEVRPVAHAFRKGKSLATTGGAGQRDNERVLMVTVALFHTPATQVKAPLMTLLPTRLSAFSTTLLPVAVPLMLTLRWFS